ncbi:MAG: hypothetical protein R3182_13190 [Draconibacterium sp.]|nr:hypothetical protein [Draconibacterium sp.]
MAKDEIPTNKRTRKPTAKKTFSLDDFKKKIGGEDVPDKPLEWLKLSPALQKATGLPGFPIGYTALARGFSNTGKSTAVCEAAVVSQKMGRMPVLIDTEGNLSRNRLELMGFDFDGNYISIDNDFLLEKFGKVQDKNRGEAAIEDMAEAIKFLLKEQELGNLPFGLDFLIDSIGTLDCIRTVNAQEKNTSDNNMWNAGAYEKSFKYLLNNTIPSSRKQNREYTNSLIAVQKIWIDSMGAGVVKHKGGEAFFFGARLIYHFGGIAAHGTKLVTAENTVSGEKKKIAYGVETRVGVAKNHVDGPLGGISLEGKIMSMPHGFIFEEDLNEYKKENIKYFRQILDDETLDAADISDGIENAKGGIELSDFIETSPE